MPLSSKPAYLVFDPRGLGGFLLALLLSTVFSAYILPQDFIAGTSAYWQTQSEDLTQYLAGFNAFFGQPWQWPILKIASLNWPEGTLATFVDIIPLFSTLLKLFLPSSWFLFNPFGYWILLCFCLQSIGAWWLLREAGNQNWVALFALCVLLLLFPAWLNRFGHVSLFSQWILLFAFALVLRGTRKKIVPALGWGLLLFCSLFINVYLFLMAALLFFACWIVLLLSSKRNQAIAIFFTFMLTGMALIWITMWPIPPSLGSVEFGFGFYSMNILAPISGGDFWKITPNHLTPEQQFEGLNYLGAGTLFLLLYSVVFKLNLGLYKPQRFNAFHSIWPRSIWFMLLLMAMYALSNHISLGSLILYKWPTPDWALPITGQFRASSRFFWPLGYALTIYAVIYIARAHSARTAAGILILACCIQILDSKTALSDLRHRLQTPATPVMDFKQIHDLIPSNAQTLYLFPKLKCNMHSSFAESQLPLMLYASQHKMNINTGYIARHTPVCSQEKSEIASSNLNKSVYVFVNAEYSDSAMRSMFDSSSAIQCKKIKLVTLCTVIN